MWRRLLPNSSVPYVPQVDDRPFLQADAPKEPQVATSKGGYVLLVDDTEKRAPAVVNLFRPASSSAAQKAIVRETEKAHKIELEIEQAKTVQKKLTRLKEIADAKMFKEEKSEYRRLCREIRGTKMLAQPVLAKFESIQDRLHQLQGDQSRIVGSQPGVKEPVDEAVALRKELASIIAAQIEDVLEPGITVRQTLLRPAPVATLSLGAS